MIAFLWVDSKGFVFFMSMTLIFFNFLIADFDFRLNLYSDIYFVCFLLIIIIFYGFYLCLFHYFFPCKLRGVVEHPLEPRNLRGVSDPLKYPP